MSTASIETNKTPKPQSMFLTEIPTPALVLDRNILARNLKTMSQRMHKLGVQLRPHLKTAKAAQIAQLATANQARAITVSTLREVEYFANNGYHDITYAIGITRDKLPAITRIQSTGAKVHLLTDDLNIANAIAQASSQDNPYSVFIDIDTGYHRSGVLPDSEALLAIAQTLNDAPNVNLAGVLTHAGNAYDAQDTQSIILIAEEERAGATNAADRLRANGIPCPIVSVGSTPTMKFAKNLQGVTETRPGNYMFYDLSMCARGVCDIQDIAISVLTQVVVNQPDRQRVLIDAGALAMSLDKSANAAGMQGIGYGMVCDLKGQPTEGIVIEKTSQEHGWLGNRENGNPIPNEEFPIGSRWRVLPNHSCMTAAAYDQYHVIDGGDEIVDIWPRINQWIEPK